MIGESVPETYVDMNAAGFMLGGARLAVTGKGVHRVAGATKGRWGRWESEKTCDGQWHETRPAAGVCVQRAS